MHGFARQQAQARFLMNETDVGRSERAGHYKSNRSISAYVDDRDVSKLSSELVSPNNFGEFVHQAYGSEHGYAIRVNPVTGEKEMMVAGSKSIGDWILNAYDTGLYGADKLLDVILEGSEDVLTGGLYHKDPHVKLFSRADRVRAEYTKQLERVARAHGVDVIYGHSRGGAIVADMDIPATKVGIDAAMLIANNTSELNLTEAGSLIGLFDTVIGLTGEENEHIDLGNHIHKIWK